MKKYQFDFKTLEASTRKAFCQFCGKDSAESRTSFFESVRDLTYAILSVSKLVDKDKHHPEEIAYEYAIYLFERVITGKFKPKQDPHDFPWTQYIKLNVKHVIFSIHKADKDWQDLLEDFQFFVQNEGEFLDETVQVDRPLDDMLYKKETAKHILNAIKVYYSYDEIQRLLPMAMELILAGNSYAFSSRVPTDLRTFCITLVSVTKRYAIENPRNKYSGDTDKLLKSSLRSTLFLSAIANNDFFPKELLLTLDIDSLSRLIQVCGGRTIRIPFPQELDSLLCSVVAVSRIIKEGKEIECAISDTKSNSDFNLSRQINIQEFVTKMVDVFATFKEDRRSKPLVSMLIESVRSLEKAVRDVSTIEETKLTELSKILDDFSSAVESLPKYKVEGIQYG